MKRNSITVQDLKGIVKALLNDSQGCQKSIMIWGPSGIGKSAACYQVAEEEGAGMIEVRTSQFSTVDFMGVPGIDHDRNKTVWYTPGWAPDVKRDGQRGILFIDELNCAVPAVQTAAYRLIHDRVVGDGYKLPEGWLIVAAGNRMTDRGVTYRMAQPLANKFFMHIHVRSDYDSWKSWAFQNMVHPDVIGFLGFKPELLHKAPDGGQEPEGFPTPRTWAGVSLLLGLFKEQSGLYDRVADCVGQGAAHEFATYRRVHKDLPNIEAILSNRKVSYSVPSTRADILYTLTSTFVSKVLAAEKNSRQVMIDGAIRFMANAPIEFGYLLVKDFVRQCLKDLAKSGEYKKFVAQHKDVLSME